jgi:hypothetical protein
LIKKKFLLNGQLFRDNFGNLYFLEKEDKRRSMTKKKVEKRSLPEKQDYLSILEIFWSPY